MAEQRRPCKGPCGKNRAERFFTSPRGRICVTCQKAKRRVSTRKARVSNVYGLSAEDIQTLMDEQGGVCAICKGVRAYALDVDHDHKLEAEGLPIRASVRGLLCRHCNRKLLPAGRDNPALLRAAADYLERGARWPN